MATMDSAIPLEEQIDQWRSYLRRRQVIHPVDVAELEDHLREQIAQLSAAGLSNDEAFLVAVRRMGGLDQLSREFAREHSERLWKQLVASSVDVGQSREAERKDAIVAICLAVAAALAIKAPALFGLTLEGDSAFYARNLSLFVLPLLTGYFIWKRKAGGAMVRWLAAAFVLALLVANLLPLPPRGATDGLRALHLPIALWLAVGVAYAGKRWNEVGGRMDFIRFSGELFIYYVLIALGGGVLTAFMMMIFMTVGINVEWIFIDWLLPCGAMGAVIVAAWLVEAKQSVIENMAPVLARLFTPLFAAVLIVFLAVIVWTGRGIDIQRDMLIAFDLLLVMVLGLLLYSVSARDPLAPPNAYDVLQLVLVVSALLADAIALWAIAARIGEFGVTPNRIAALGENLVLLVNLGGAALYSVRFLRAKGSFADIERWQTNYLPVYAAWAVIVVVVFPPAFGFA
jgi:hypothetical protein